MIPRLKGKLARVLRNGIRVANSRVSDHAVLGPKTVAVSLANVCNAGCVFCVHFSEHSTRVPAPAATPFCELPYLEELARDFRAMRVEEVFLSGLGDPIGHPQIEEICGLFGRCHDTVLITNGISLHRKDLSRLVGRRGSIRLSLHAGTRDTWARVHPTNDPSQFDRITETVRQIQRTYGDRVTLHNVICRQNFHECIAMLELALELGVKSVRFVPLTARELRDPERFALSPADQRSVSEQMVAVARLADEHRIETNAPTYRAMLDTVDGSSSGAPSPGHQVGDLYRRIACTVGYVMAIVSQDGQVRPCCRCDRIGSFAGSSFAEFWNGAEYRAFRRAGRAIRQTGRVERCACDICKDFETNIRVHNILHPADRFRADS